MEFNRQLENVVFQSEIPTISNFPTLASIENLRSQKILVYNRKFTTISNFFYNLLYSNEFLNILRYLNVLIDYVEYSFKLIETFFFFFFHIDLSFFQFLKTPFLQDALRSNI